MSILKGYIKPLRGLIFLAILFKFLGSIANLMFPRILAHMIDEIAPTGDLLTIYQYGGAMLLLAVLSCYLNLSGNQKASKASCTVTQTLRQDLFQKSFSLSLKQIDTLSISSLESRLTSDTYHVNQVMGMILRLGVGAPINLIGGILLSLTMDLIMTLVIVVTMPIIMLFTVFISNKAIPMFTRVQKDNDTLIGKIRENVTGIRVIKAFSTMEYEKKGYDEYNKALTKEDEAASMVMAVSNPFINYLLNIGTIIVIIIGAFRAGQGLCEPGVILAIITYFTVISNAMLSITRIYVQSAKAIASLQRIQEVFELDEEFDAENEKDKTAMPCGFIEFKHVYFSYLGKEQQLQDIHVSLKKGETLGILGATGSGKSTLLMLLMRFYDVSSGQIRIDGKNVKDIPFEQLHKMFGVALQNDYLLNDTIYENVSFGRNLSEEAVENACRIAQASTFIEKYPEKYQHKLSIKGSNLSGGQKQRILIARALAGNPDILILDDSSSALDYQTDAKLRQELQKKSHTTTVIVAQRISSVLQSDKILVLDHGKMAGYGTHEELVGSCGIYRQIYEIQMGRSEELQ